jgi:hypothetical protein
MQEPSFGGISSKSSSLVSLLNRILLFPLCTFIMVFAVDVPIAQKLKS